jgi:hypothetical protein
MGFCFCGLLFFVISLFFLISLFRIIVVASLLLTIPVDSLVASSTWRRLYSRYLKLKLAGSSFADGDGQSAYLPARNGDVGETSSGPVSRGKSNHVLDDSVTDCSTSAGTDAEAAAAGRRGGGGGGGLRETALGDAYRAPSMLSSSCPTECGDTSRNTGSSAGGKTLDGSWINTEDVAGTGERETHRSTMAADKPQAGSLSQLETPLFPSSASLGCPTVPPGSSNPELSTLNEKQYVRRSPSAASLGSGASSPDRKSFSSTGGASSVTGTGVAGNRMLSKDEMNNILRGISMDSKSSKAKARKGGHGADDINANDEAALNSSWLSNMSYEESRADGAGLTERGQVQAPAKTIFAGNGTPCLIWALCVVVCLFVDHWMYFAATVGTISTTMLLFIFPTMFYFRMTLSSDFGATPIFGRIVPNMLYMSVIQFIGIIILLADLLVVICLIFGY